MSSVTTAAGSARPLSGGVWSLFSWLRRDEEEDSDSSAGSDRTVASFAFLTPSPPYNQRHDGNRLPGPTDSYKKRVRECNARRVHDRDLTLCRKYGLFRGEGYDAFSLPSRKHLVEKRDRDRRATSESLRLAHVPGKRRAPPPPGITARPQSLAITTGSLTRRHSRKRPAPQPPIRVDLKVVEIPKYLNNNRAQMTSRPDPDRNHISNSDRMELKPEKYSKTDSATPEPKLKKEKSFFKTIFDKKRISSIDPTPERILPNISELDKQAAEIIESMKLKPLEQNNIFSNDRQGDTWFCTRCLRKYNSTVVTCQYCLPAHKMINNNYNIYTQTDSKSNNVLPSSSRVSGVRAEDKQKLKEMLKEMKDSLPKKPNHVNNANKDNSKQNQVPDIKTVSSLESPTLRIGTVIKEDITLNFEGPSTSKQIETPKVHQILVETKKELLEGNVVVTQPVVLLGPQSINVKVPKNQKNYLKNISGPIKSMHSSYSANNDGIIKPKPNAANIANNSGTVNINIPLKISSLLNPVYIPKSIFSEGQPKNEDNIPNLVPFETTRVASTISKPDSNSEILLINATSKRNAAKKEIKPLTEMLTKTKEINKLPVKSKMSDQHKPSSSNDEYDRSKSENSNLSSSNFIRMSVEQHSKRRDLINQLEQSIANGDEGAAAEAAAKLAQLKLACSVLSFSSQITNKEASVIDIAPTVNTSLTQSIKAKEIFLKTAQEIPTKVNAAVQSSAIVVTKEDTKNVRSKAEKGVSTRKEIQKTKPVPASTKNLNKLLNKDGKLSTPQGVLSTEPSTSRNSSVENGIATIDVWVEDREATRGPVRLRIPRGALMGELRRQAELSLGLASRLQRWIVGRVLCIDDGTPLATLAGPELDAPFYLCVVESDTNTLAARLKLAGTSKRNIEPCIANDHKSGDVYAELVQLERRALVHNTEPFECGVCMEECRSGQGVVLRECVHAFCRECLSDLIRHCEEAVVSCPAMGCPSVLQEREIRALVSPEEYERWLARGLAAAESGTRNAFHCRTRDCTGWALCEPGVRRFPCSVCGRNNCVPCQAIHEGETCEQHHAKQRETNLSSETDEGTQALLDTLITKGEALACPECSSIITKKWGCDWVKCSACKTEICWVTRGRRWGPAGRGDTSGGCQCGVDGRRCHPSCAYCH